MRRNLFALLLIAGLILPAASQVAPAPAKSEDLAKRIVRVEKPVPVPEDIRPGFETIGAKESLAMLGFIASDLTEGRETGSRGYQIAAEYAASILGLWKITPVGQFAPRRFSLSQMLGGTRSPSRPMEKTFYQEFALQETIDASTQMTLEARSGGALLKRTFQSGIDYSGSFVPGDVLTAPVVFAGYGVTDTAAGYDDLKGVDIKGKIVIVLSGSPSFLASKPAAQGRAGGQTAEEMFSSYGNLPARLQVLAKKGPAAILMANPALRDTDRYRSLLPPKNIFDEEPIIRRSGGRMSLPGGANPLPWDRPSAITITGRTADAILGAAGLTLESLKKKIDDSKKPASQDIPGAALTLSSTQKIQWARGINVVGMIEGSDPKLKSEAVVIGAHLDHVGKVEDYIFNGSDDNGSGSVGVLNLARAFSANPRKPKRTIFFCLWTGEEKGLLGSRYFVQNPPVPGIKTVAYLNMDMISRPYDERTILNTLRGYGLKDAAEIAKAVKPANFMPISYMAGTDLGEAARAADRYVGLDLYLRDAAGSSLGMGNSDHASFHDVKIPWLLPISAFTVDLHQPSDSVDKADGVLMERVSKLMYGIAWILADRQAGPPER